MNLMFEQLEQRLLLAASANLKKNGTLIISGSGSDDTVALTGTGVVGTIAVDVNGDGVADETYEGVKNITIRTKKGNDTVTIENVELADNGRINVNLGGGDDTLTVIGSTLLGNRSRVSLSGGSGTDSLIHEDNQFLEDKVRFASFEETAAPLDPFKLADDVYETTDGDLLRDNLRDNDGGETERDYGSHSHRSIENLLSGFIQSIAGNGLEDDTYNADGELTLTLAYGNLAVAADGQFTYVPTADVPSGTTVTETFTYTVADIDGNVSTATTTITIHGDPEARPNPDEIQFTEDGNALVSTGDTNLLDNDDPGPGIVKALEFYAYVDNSLYASVPFSAPEVPISLKTKTAIGAFAEDSVVGTLWVEASGEVTFTPEPGLLLALDGHDTLLFRFDYHLQSNIGISSNQVTITIVGEDDIA